jgi:peptidoglycan/LPS O-acetylase OafA/YrhL
LLRWESVAFTLGHRPALDGVRGCAIIGVLGLHAGEVLEGGYIGVQVFFVLSGFVITAVLLEEARETSAISLARFYVRRALRLLPALAAVLAFVGVLSLIVSEQRWVDHLGRDALATTFYYANWLATRAGNLPHPLVHTWSLSVEEQFYLLWPPVLALLVFRRAGYRTLMVACVGGVVASAAVRYALFSNGSGVNRAYFGTDVRLDAMLVGCALAVAAYAGWLPTSRTAIAGVRVAAGIGCVVTAWVAYAVPRTDGVLYEGGLTVVAVLSAAIIAAVLLAPEAGLARALTWRPLRYVGTISYGLYLWHLPVLFAVRSALPRTSNLVVAPLMVAISLALAALSYQYLEQPFLRLKERLRGGSVQRYPRYVKISP